jgi:hypothetical protein
MAMEGQADTLLRDGNYLVIERGSLFPERCVITNEVHDLTRIKLKLSWHHPNLYLLVALAIVPYFIARLFFTKRVEVELSVSSRVLKKKRQRIQAAWALFVASAVCISLGMLYTSSLWILVLIGILIFFYSIYTGTTKAHIVEALRIERKYVWIKGIHPAFLALLPPYSEEEESSFSIAISCTGDSMVEKRGGKSR